ncbi:hypothetical protein QQ054_11060 [Oscillatoria amoena NRMC-F 0135]|nr:hypothetical protein [Oscillatoria amoena NRMC-F 0135]
MNATPSHQDFCGAMAWLVLGLCAQMALSVALIGFGLYSPILGALLILTFALLVGGAALERMGMPFFAPKKKIMIFAGCLLAVATTLWLYAVPAERMMGRDDQGAYSNVAIHLARTGQYTVSSPALGQIAPESKKWFLSHMPTGAFQLRENSRLLWHHHIGYRAEGDRIVPVFPPVYPVFLSGAYGIAGWTGMEWQGYVLLICAAALSGVLVSRLWGAMAGMAMTLLWLFFPLNLWFARTYYAENLLVCVWLLILCLLMLPPSKKLLLALGLLAGLSPLIKIDSLLLVAGFAAYAWVSPFRLAGLTGLFIGGFVSLAWFIFSGGGSYPLDILGNLGAGKWLGLCVAGVGIPLIFLWADGRKKMAAFLSEPWVWRVGAILLLLLALYACFLRPLTDEPHTFYYAAVGGVVESGREKTFPRLGWYLTVPGLWLAMAGLLLWFLDMRRAHRVAVLFWCVGVGALIFFCYELRNAPVFPYGMRRMMVYAAPVLLAGFVFLFTKAKRSPVLPLITAMALIAGWTPLNSRMNTERNFPDMRRQIDALGKLLPPGAIVLTGADEPGTFLVSPLQVIHGIDTFALNAPSAENSIVRIQYESALIRQVNHWQDHGRPVYFLTAFPDNLIPSNLPVTPAFKTRIQSRFFPQSAELPIAPAESWEYHFAVFRRSKTIARSCGVANKGGIIGAVKSGQ